MTTNEAQRREDMLLDMYKIHAYIPNDAEGNPLTQFGNFCAGYEAATTEANKRIAELEREIAEWKELLSDRTQDLEFEYNRAEENFLNFGILQSKLDNLKDIHEGINCPICGSLAVTPKEMWYAKQISELQASNNRLREAIKNMISTKLDAYGHHQIMSGKDEYKILKLIESTPAESLQAFKNEMMEYKVDAERYSFMKRHDMTDVYSDFISHRLNPFEFNPVDLDSVIDEALKQIEVK